MLSERSDEWLVEALRHTGPIGLLSGKKGGRFCIFEKDETMTKQYAERDITSKELMQPYITHVSAMTGEGLHSKSDIAAELAWRDVQIEKLKAALEYSVSYLDAGKLNSIGHGSKAHQEMRNALSNENEKQ